MSDLDDYGPDADKIVLAAQMLGFVEQADGSFTCSRQQIVLMSVMVAQEAIRQANEQNNRFSPT